VIHKVTETLSQQETQFPLLIPNILPIEIYNDADKHTCILLKHKIESEIKVKSSIINNT
jgi:hypothetical protein